MDAKWTTLNAPDVTDEYQDWFKMVPQVSEPKEEINIPAPGRKPSPLPARETNEWFTVEPQLEAQAEARAEEMKRFILENSKDPEETMARLRSAHYLAAQHDLDPTYVYDNFGEITEEYYGRKMDGISNWEAIQNSRKTGQITSELGDLYYQVMWGDTSEETQARIAELQGQMPSLDEQKRSLPVRAVQSMMEMLPMMGDIMLEGAKTGVMAGAGGAAITALAGNLGPQIAVPEEIATVPSAAMYMYTVGQAAGSAQASTKKEAGLAYMDMIQSGVSEDTARIVAMGVGAVNGTIEVLQIQSIPGISDATRKALQTAAKKGVEKAIGGNGVKKLAWEFGKRYFGGTVGETAQELTQETVSFLGESIAKEMDGIEAPGKEAYIERIQETAIQSMLGFGVMALPGSVVNSDTAAVIRSMREGTPASTIKTESGATVPGPQVGQYRETETAIPMEITEIEPLSHVNPNSKEYKLAQEEFNRAKAGEGTMAPIRVIATEEGYVAIEDAPRLQVALEEGETAVQVEVVQSEDNQTTAPGAQYDAPIGPNPVQDTAETTEAAPEKLDWQKTSTEFLEADPVFEADKTEFINTSSVEDLTANIRTAFPEMSTNEVYAGVALVEARAAVQGKDVSEYIQETFDPQIFTREKILNQDGTDANYKAAAEFLDNGKALIHLTEQSDFSSWLHEYGHIIRPELPQADQKILLDHYQETEWTRDAEETFVKDFEEYLYSGNAPSFELKEIFRRIQDALKKIWERIGRTATDEQLPQEVAAVFDRIFRELQDVNMINPLEMNDADLDHSLDDVLFQENRYNSAFKDWFGESKIVDNFGFPKIVYHGSPVQIEAFQLQSAKNGRMWGDGFYFTENKNDALKWAEQAGGEELHEVYLSMQNPLVFTKNAHEDLITNSLPEDFKNWILETHGDEILRKSETEYPTAFELSDFRDRLPEYAKEYGYDGIIGDFGDNTHYVAFESTQIKSKDNQGTWSKDDPRILFQPDEIFEGSDGLSYTIHEEGAKYETEEDQKVYEEISGELEALREPTGEGTEGDLSVPGRSSERPVYSQWKRQKRIDLTGFVASDTKDLAEAFSVYRNPYNEYVHFIYTKTDPKTGETIILGHNALTSGLPGLTMGAEDVNKPAKSLFRLNQRMERLGADGYFILHNHPSGRPDPSRADLRLTSMYEQSVPGFEGHIILNHETYGFIGHHRRTTENSYIPKVTYGEKAISERTFSSPDDLAAYSRDVMGDDGRDALIFLDGRHRVMAFEPVKGVDHETAYQKMRGYGAAKVVYATTDQKRYAELSLKDRNIQKGKDVLDVFLDIFQVNNQGGSLEYHSAMEEFYKKPGMWQEAAFDKAPAGFLFQPNEEHEAIVRQAVEEFKPVPQEVLEEYDYTDWGKAEIKRRKIWTKYAWMENLAVGFDDWQELKLWFVDHGGATETDAIKKMGTDTADRFYKELWMRSNRKTRDENNKAFIKQYANRDGVIALAGEIAADPHSFKGQGIPGPLFALKAAMTGKNGIKSRTFQAAITSVKNNPTEIRRALALVQGDEEILDMMLFEDEMEDMTPVEAKVRELSPKERIKQAIETKDPELRKALLSGDASEDSLKEMLRASDRKMNALKAQHTKQIKELQEKLGWQKSETLALKETLEKKIMEAKEAKDAAGLEQLELIKKTRAEMRGNWKKRREVELAKDRMRSIAYNIQRKPSPMTIHVDYQKEIMELQKLLHPGFRRKGDAEAWFKKNEFYQKYPAALEVLKPEDIDKITKKPLNYWTIEELEELNEKVNQLREQGRDTLNAQQNERELAARSIAVQIALDMGEDGIASAPNVPHTPHNETYRKWMETGKVDSLKAETWRPSRLLRAMGGAGKTMEKYFWRDLNKHTDLELKKVQERQGAGKAKMKELGITMKDLQRPCQGPEGPFPVNDVMQWYIVQGNEDNVKAIAHGVGVPFESWHYYFDQLTDGEKAMCDHIAQDFEENYDRYAEAYAADKNEVMGKVEGGYFPMRRLRDMEQERAEDLAKDLTTSKGVQKGYAGRKGTHSRQEISDEHQTPIKLGAIDLWMQEIVEQEHYINSGLYIKEMQRVIADPVFKTAVVDKHGSKLLDWMQKYVNEFANPTLYKFYDSTTQISKQLRNNLAIAYLSCNMLTVAKQFPSVALFMGRTNPVRLTAAAGKFASNPWKWLEFVNERDPQMQERSMDRVFEELKTVKNTKWDKSIKPIQRLADNWEGVVKKWGEVGMAPITMVDKMATTIGWLAVYDQNVEKVGEEEAIRLAQEAVLETQPAARAKDLAQLYRSSEGLNWFLMFTNQINQTWNIITADIPAAVQGMQVQNALGMVAGMMVSFAGIAALGGWKPWEEDEPEDFAKSTGEMIGKALLNTIPVAGSSIVSGFEGWMGSGVDPVPAANVLGQLIGTVGDGDTEKTLKKIVKLAETGAVMTGTPIMPIKRGKKAVNALAQGEPGDAALEALGYRTGEDY